MPRPKKETPASRSGGAVVRNPFEVPGPAPEALVPHVPAQRFIVPPAAPMPEFRAHGHVLTERGWVREEGNHDG